MDHLPEKGPENTISEWTSLEQSKGGDGNKKEAKGSQRIVGTEGVIHGGIRYSLH